MFSKFVNFRDNFWIYVFNMERGFRIRSAYIRAYTSSYFNPSPIVKSCMVHRQFQVETCLREKGLKFVGRESSENHTDPWTRVSRWLWTWIEDVSTRGQGFVTFCGQRWHELKMEGTRKFWGSDKSLLEISLGTDRGWLVSVTDVAQRGWIGLGVLIGLHV